MTAIALYVADDRVVIFSDAVAYDDEGVVRQIHSKQLILPERSCVITSSGSGPVILALQHKLATEVPADFDEIAHTIPELAKEIFCEMSDYYGPEWSSDFMLLYGGWSDEHNQFRGFHLQSVANPPGAPFPVEAFVPKLMAAYTKPNPDAASLKREGIEDVEEAMQRLGFEEFGKSMMMAQRTSKMILHSDTEQRGFGVGGFIQRTILRRDYAESCIVHRWPDVVGEKINPILAQ